METACEYSCVRGLGGASRLTKQVACAPMPLDAFTESADHGGYVDKSSGAGGCKIDELTNRIKTTWSVILTRVFRHKILLINTYIGSGFY